MIWALVLFIIPLLLFVLAFLYETFLSFRRLGNPKAGRSGYVHATWEVTHTLLVFAVVMLLMLFTKSIEDLASKLFLPAMLAAIALLVRYICYIYIFYVKTSKKPGMIDWLFAVSHVVAALFLVITALSGLLFVIQKDPPVNTQFIPAYIPGLLLVVAVCALPLGLLYFGKLDKQNTKTKSRT